MLASVVRALLISVAPILLLLLLACAAGHPCGRPASGSISSGQPERITLSDGWLAMGTFFEIDLRLQPGREEEARAWLDWAREEIVRLERIYSRHDPQSELSELNRALAEGAPAPTIGPELEGLLEQARSLSHQTQGAFDVTIGPLIDLWREAAAADRWPGQAEIRSALMRVGSERFDLERQGTTTLVQVKGAGLRLDLDGLSKGVVLDRLQRSLRERLPSAAALLSFGQSSLLAIGDAAAPGQGWMLEIRSRDPARVDPGRIRLRNRALSMSSSLGSSVEVGGRRVSHVVDPRSGGAVEGTVEALVLAPSAAQADAWSTALLVLGAHEAPRTVFAGMEALGLEARIFDSEGRGRATAGWSATIADEP